MDSLELVNLAKEYEEAGNEEEAYRLYLEAAQADENGEAIYRIGRIYYERDYYEHFDGSKCCKYFELAHERGADMSSDVYIVMGAHRKNGLSGIQQDYALAKKWYEIAIEKGCDYGYVCLGEMYYLGEGVEQDYKKAYELFVRSDSCEPMTMYYLGRMHEFGEYVPKDIEKAREYYEIAIKDDYYGDMHANLARQELRELDEAENDK